MRKLLMASVVALAGAAQAAQAAVTYTATLNFSDQIGASTYPYTLTLVLTRPTSITAAGSIVPDSCTASTGFTCTDWIGNPTPQYFDPNGLGSGKALISVGIGTTSGQSVYFLPYYFDAGAFLADGTYQAIQGWFVGADGDDHRSAGTGTLVVSGTAPPTPVPEPAALALLGAGLAGLRLVRRRLR